MDRPRFVSAEDFLRSVSRAEDATLGRIDYKVVEVFIEEAERGTQAARRPIPVPVINDLVVKVSWGDGPTPKKQ